MKIAITFITALIIAVLILSCEKLKEMALNNGKVYFEVGFKGPVSDWRDSSFIVATGFERSIKEAFD